ncbi:hypothetical protein FOA52_016200 [Chlamydomonas sp. UWO 241]|nr:hypothetical protein FOA52_016200 [Chlamydomonas sp. UWO 241]
MSTALFPEAYPVESASTAKPLTIALTGATGFVAGSILQRLLALGHTVHGTCRDPAKAKALMELPGASVRLKLFAADLTTPGAYDEAFQGCDAVVHCASPYISTVKPGKEAQEKLVKPAVQGTENVLASVNKVATIKRVVLTSSCAAIYGIPGELGKDHVYTEADWCASPSVDVLPYFFSKREAEKRAWAMAEEQDRWDLVTINPAAVFGPPMTARSDGESISILRDIYKGKAYPATPKLGMGVIDVRDVALAHSLALFTPTAKGRYIMVESSGWFSEYATICHELYPKVVGKPFVTVPKFLLYVLGPFIGMGRDLITNCVGHPVPRFDTSKVKSELGIKEFIPMSVTFKNQIDKMLELKMM